MKPTHLLSILISCLLLLQNGCKKEQVDDTIDGRIKTVTYDGNKVDTYTYNNDGRVASVLLYGGTRITYTYSASALKQEYYTPNGIKTGESNIALNIQGLLAINSRKYMSGYLQEEVQAGVRYTYTYKNDNLIKEEAHNAIDNLFYGRTTYTYYTDKVDHRNFGSPFYGKRSKNLIQTVTEHSNKVISYTYEFDSKGRVTKEIGSINGGAPSEVSYTYF